MKSDLDSIMMRELLKRDPIAFMLFATKKWAVGLQYHNEYIDIDERIARGLKQGLGVNDPWIEAKMMMATSQISASEPQVMARPQTLASNSRDRQDEIKAPAPSVGSVSDQSKRKATNPVVSSGSAKFSARPVARDSKKSDNEENAVEMAEMASNARPAEADPLDDVALISLRTAR